MGQETLIDPPEKEQKGKGRRDDYEMVVEDGTPLKVAVSCLIKELRRGNELEGLYWAKQMEPRFWRYVWRRLLIFASEDISIANPDAVVQVRALWENYETVKKDSKNPVVDRSIITMAVMVLARSPKSRECDDLLNAYGDLTKWGWRAQVPPYALDMHTQTGRKMPHHLRGRFWMEVAAAVRPHVGPLDWRLWLLKRYAHFGFYRVEWVNRVAERWMEQGRLKYGADGYPGGRFAWDTVDAEFPEHEPIVPTIHDWPDIVQFEDVQGRDSFLAIEGPNDE